MKNEVDKFDYITRYHSKMRYLLTFYYICLFNGLYILGRGLLGYPIFCFLTERGRFDDFYNSINFAPHLPASDSAYLLSVFMLWLFQTVNGLNPNGLFIAYNCLLATILIFGYIQKNGRHIYHILLLFVSYPIIFAVSRGNAELMAFGLVFIGIVYLEKKRHGASLFFLLLAATIKPTAAVFLIFMLMDFKLQDIKQYILFGALNIIVFLLIKGNLFSKIISTKQMAINYFNGYIIGDGGTLFNNSLYGLIKFILLYLNVANEYLISVAHIYQRIAPIMMILFIGVYFIRQKRVLWRDVAFLANALCLFMTVSADYRLVYFLLPLIFINELDINCKTNYYIIILIFLIILPKHFIFYHLTNLDIAVTSQTIINPLLELILFFALFDIKYKRISVYNWRNLLCRISRK